MSSPREFPERPMQTGNRLSFDDPRFEPLTALLQVSSWRPELEPSDFPDIDGLTEEELRSCRLTLYANTVCEMVLQVVRQKAEGVTVEILEGSIIERAPRWFIEDSLPLLIALYHTVMTRYDEYLAYADPKSRFPSDLFVVANGAGSRTFALVDYFGRWGAVKVLRTTLRAIADELSPAPDLPIESVEPPVQPYGGSPNSFSNQLLDMLHRHRLEVAAQERSGREVVQGNVSIRALFRRYPSLWAILPLLLMLIVVIASIAMRFGSR